MAHQAFGALKERSERIANIIAQEVGTPLSFATPVQAGLPVAVTAGYAKLITEIKLEQEIGNSLVVREPFGVVGAITPWNYPLHQIMAKAAPALAAGCTVVLKPSEIAPLNAFLLAEACEAIGLPAGVLNIVTGFGPVAGEAIASHPLVDMISFTGSLRAGKRVGALAAESIKKVTLELGGKSAFIVLDDAPFEKAIPAGARNAMLRIRADVLCMDAHDRAAQPLSGSGRRSRGSNQRIQAGGSSRYVVQARSTDLRDAT